MKPFQFFLISISLFTNANAQFFTESYVAYAYCNKPRIAIGDIDNDKDTDFIISGLVGFEKHFLHVNESGNAYTTTTIPDIPREYRSGLEWMDFNRDGLLDLNFGNKIYLNDGSGGYTLFDLFDDSRIEEFLSMADLDFDGDLDLFVPGLSGVGEQQSAFYLNNNGDFTKQVTNIPIIHEHGLTTFVSEWMDFDKDHDMDVLIYGMDYSGNMSSALYENNNGTFHPRDEMNLGSYPHFIDIDSDGDLDIFSEFTYYQSLHENINGTDFVERQISGLHKRFSRGDLEWGDINNDGYPDLVVSGQPYGEDYSTKIYLNNDGTDFTLLDSLDFAVHFYRGDLKLFDFDNDGDLDILICNDFTTDGMVVKLFSNNIHNEIIQPAPPSGIYAEMVGGKAILHWNKSAGNIQSTGSNTAMIFIKDSSSNELVFAPGAHLEDGYRKTPGPGLVSDTTLIIHKLEPGKYYWGVQHVDQAFNGSAFSAIDSFEMLDPFTRVNTNIMVLESVDGMWGDYDNDNDLDFILMGEGEDQLPHTILVQNMGNGSFQIVNDTPFPDLFPGSVTWWDYNNDGFIDLLMSGRAAEDDYKALVFKNLSGNGFEEQTGITLIDGNPNTASGDFNNDGRADIIISGKATGDAKTTKIYANKGNGIFRRDTTIELEGKLQGNNSITDFNNDGYLDLLLNRIPYLENDVPKLYRNNQNGFERVTDIEMPVLNGTFAWADTDCDGDLDLFIRGNTNSGNQTLFYRNDASSFIKKNISVRGANSTSLAPGDYDNDGDPDLATTGQHIITSSEIQINNGNNTFSESDFGFQGVRNGLSIWGDYDADHDLDLLITGYSTNYLYSNNGNWLNQPPDPPTGLKVRQNGYQVIFSWDSAHDDTTPAQALSYNIRIGTSNGGREIVSPLSGDNGILLVPQQGNCFLNRHYIIDSIMPGTYFWSVQAVDNTFQGSDWSEVTETEIRNIWVDFLTDTVCHGTQTSFQDQSISYGEQITSWNWDFGDGTFSSLQNPVHTFSQSGTYLVKLVAGEDQYKDSIVKEVVVKAKPGSNFDADLVCQGTPTTFINSTITNDLDIISWQWEFGDGSISVSENSASHGYLNPGDYQVKLISFAANGCADTVQKTVSVAGFPSASVSVNGPVEFCEGDSVILSGTYHEEYSYQWKQDGVAITGAVTNNYKALSSGAYAVEIVNTKGNCVSISDEIEVIVNATPSAPFISSSADTEFCYGDSIILSVAHQPGFQYQWNYNGGSYGENSNSLVVKNSGDYSAVIKNAAGCSKYSYNTVHVTASEPPLINNFSIGGNTLLCKGDSLTMGVPETDNYTYQWYKNEQPMLNAFGNIYATKEDGIYYLSVSNQFGCVTYSDKIQVTVLDDDFKPELEFAKGSPFVCPEDEVVLSIENFDPSFNYLWMKNGIVINHSSSQEYRITGEGIYTVNINAQGCEILSDPVEITHKPALPKPGIIAEGPNIWYLACTNDSANIYKWYHDGNIVEEGENHIYIAGQQLGRYCVKISRDGECLTSSDQIAIPENKIMGIQVIDPWEKLRIYPNPTPGLFTLEMDNQIHGELVIDILGDNGVRVVNIKFQKELNHLKTQIDLSGQPAAIYIIKLALEDYRTTRRLVVGH